VVEELKKPRQGGLLDVSVSKHNRKLNYPAAMAAIGARFPQSPFRAGVRLTLPGFQLKRYSAELLFTVRVHATITARAGAVLIIIDTALRLGKEAPALGGRPRIRQGQRGARRRAGRCGDVRPRRWPRRGRACTRGACKQRGKLGSDTIHWRRAKIFGAATCLAGWHAASALQTGGVCWQHTKVTILILELP